MGVVDDLYRATTILLSHPGLFVVLATLGLVSGFLSGPEQFGVGQYAAVLVSIASFLVSPVLVAAELGLVEDVLDDGRATRAGLLDAIHHHALSLLLVNVLVALAAVGFVLLAVLLLSIPVLNFLAAIPLLFAAIVGALVIQFVHVAVVVTDAKPVSAIQVAYEFVTRHTGRVVGYTLLSSALAVAFSVPLWLGSGIDATASSLNPGFTSNLVFAAVSPHTPVDLLVVGIGQAVLLTFHVVFFRRLVTEPSHLPRFEGGDPHDYR